MSLTKAPVFLWRDNQGLWTAVVLDHWDLSAVGDSATNAVEQIRNGLTTLARRGDGIRGGQWADAECSLQRFTVRPVTSGRGRTFLAATPITLETPVVRGRLVGGGWAVAAPLLEVQIGLADGSTWKSAIEQVIQESVVDDDPSELRRALTAAETRLVWVPVPDNDQRSRPGARHGDRALDQVCDHLDLALLKRLESRAHQMDAVVEGLLTRLHSSSDSLVVVGETGCGKSTVILDMVRRILRDDDQQMFFRTSAGRIVAGMQFLGQWEQRVDDLVDELADANGVLIVDSLIDLLSMGGTDATDSIAAYCLADLRSGRLRLIAEATPRELAAVRLQLPALADVLSPVVVTPLNRTAAIHCLDAVIASTATQADLTVEPAFAAEVVDAFTRFLPASMMPGSAVRFVRQIMARWIRDPSHNGVLTGRDAMLAFARWSGLADRLIDDSITLAHENLVSELTDCVIGQSAACERAADVITTLKAGLVDPARPIASLLLCGPTGVGKTALVKTLAAAMFPHLPANDRVVRIDCSELGGYGALERLLGTEREPSHLLQTVREQGFSVVLLDEVEKADPLVFDTLLGVLDEGLITDTLGRVTSFRSTIVIMTSNLGAEQRVVDGFGDTDLAQARYDNAVREFFRPEFVNRIDAIVPFAALTSTMMKLIVERELGLLAERPGLRRNGITLKWTESLVDHLLSTGFNPELGARPLQQAVDRLVMRPLADRLIYHSSHDQCWQLHWAQSSGLQVQPG